MENGLYSVHELHERDGWAGPVAVCGPCNGYYWAETVEDDGPAHLAESSSRPALVRWCRRRWSDVVVYGSETEAQ